MNNITYRIINKDKLEKEFKGLAEFIRITHKYNALHKLRTIQKISAIRQKTSTKGRP